MLAVAAAFVVAAAGVGRRGARAALGPVALAALLALPMAAADLWSGSEAEPPPGRLDHPFKTESLRIRLRLWQDTAMMIRDRPLGAGSGNFLHAFLPYQLRDEGLRSEAVVYGSPHSELLRAPAEEGVLWCAVAGWLLIRLFAAVRRRVRRDGWMPPALALAAGAAFLAVESAFQFPFAMAFGCLAAAVLLGLALSLADGNLKAPAASRRAPTRLGLAAGAVVAGVVLSGLVVSDALGATAGPDARRQARACDLNPRNLRACLAAAWLDARAGRGREARARAAALLERSPYYHPAVKLLADEALAGGDERTGCFHLWIYDRLFGGRSSQHERLWSRCDPALLGTFLDGVAVPGYGRFPLAVPAGPR
jgi:hypothetical protein